VDGRTYGRTDERTLETHFIRSSQKSRPKHVKNNSTYTECKQIRTKANYRSAAYPSAAIYPSPAEHAQPFSHLSDLDQYQDRLGL